MSRPPLLRPASFRRYSICPTRTGNSRTSNEWTGMNTLSWCCLGRAFVINFFGNIRNLVRPKIGGVLIVLVIFISAKTLGHRGVKSYLACARLSPTPFERVQGWPNGATNASPVKRPIDWAVPDDCAHHAAHMRDDLLSSTYLLRISSQGRAASRL